MGSVVLDQVRSNQTYNTHTMLGGAVNQTATPSDSIYRPSSRPTSQPSQLETSSRSTSANTTPTSTTAPPSTSAVGSAQLRSHPSHDVPAYINSQSHPFTQPSMRAPSATPASSHPHPSAASMTTSSSHGFFPSDHTSHPTTHPSGTPLGHASQHARRASQTTGGVLTSVMYAGSQSSPASPRLQPTFRSFRSLGGSEASSPSRIKVRDLSHIQSFASEEFLAQSQQPRVPGQWSQERHYEISSMPVTDIIEMVAGLLTKITSTNDVHHEHVHRNIPPPDGTANLSPQATSVLAFHGKNVPSISILSYLTRIHKYCPTTYEVFLSLLVYFDRMTEMVNRNQLERLRRRTAAIQNDTASRSTSSDATVQYAPASPMVTPPSSARMRAQDPPIPTSAISSPSLHPQEEDESLSHFFVVDSFNIHRLVIAGVTCASKFFSDVFYTNSRYAKVGGLPLVELNHLELQFLLLNDFRLAIPVEELEAYGTMLVEFYAREHVAQNQGSEQSSPRSIPVNPSMPAESQSEGMYMRPRDRQHGEQPQFSQTPTPP